MAKYDKLLVVRHTFNFFHLQLFFYNTRSKSFKNNTNKMIERNSFLIRCFAIEFERKQVPVFSFEDCHLSQYSGFKSAVKIFFG